MQDDYYLARPSWLSKGINQSVNTCSDNSLLSKVQLFNNFILRLLQGHVFIKNNNAIHDSSAGICSQISYLKRQIKV